MRKEEVYRKAQENGYIIEYGKRHSPNKLYQQKDGTNVYPVVFGGDGNPEYGYNVLQFLPNDNIKVSVFDDSLYDKPAEWEDVVDFVNSL